MSSPTLAGRLLVGLGTVVTSLLAGSALGLLFVKLFVPRKAMGWDGLADALGGFMLGGLVGVVAGAVLVANLTRRAQVKAMAVATAIAALVLGGIAATAPRGSEPSPAEIERPTSGEEAAPLAPSPIKLDL